MNSFFVWFVFLCFSYIIILYLFTYFSNKKEIWNTVIGFITLSLVFINLLLILILIFQDISLYSDVLNLWLSALGLPLLINIIVLIFWSTLIYFYKKKRFQLKDQLGFKRKKKSLNERKYRIKEDLYRKIPHILMFIGIFILWGVGVYVMYSTLGSIEGMEPYENNMLYLYLQLLTEPNTIGTVLFALGWFYYLLFFFFYIFTLVMLINEFTRKSKYFSFPFNLLCKFFLNHEEEQDYGTYLYFAIGQTFAGFICPPMIFISILGISTIADLSASQVGLRFGKHYIKFNKKKTWEGALAGVIASFLISFMFIGILWALIFTIGFFLFDTLTNKPIKMSDNLLIPVGLSVMYFFIRFLFNLNYYIIILP